MREANLAIEVDGTRNRHSTVGWMKTTDGYWRHSASLSILAMWRPTEEKTMPVPDTANVSPSGPVGEAVRAIDLLSKTTASNFKDGTGIGLQGLGALHLIAGVSTKIVAGFPIVNFTFSSADFITVMIVGAILTTLGSAVKVFEFYYFNKLSNRLIDTAVDGNKQVQDAARHAYQNQRPTA